MQDDVSTAAEVWAYLQLFSRGGKSTEIFYPTTSAVTLLKFYSITSKTKILKST